MNRKKIYMCRNITFVWVVLIFCAHASEENDPNKETNKIDHDEKEGVHEIYPVYDYAITLFLNGVTESKYPGDFKAIREHGAGNIVTDLSFIVSQAFAIYVIRDEFKENSKINRSYKYVLKDLINNVGKENVRKMIKRAYLLGDKKYGENEIAGYAKSFLKSKKNINNQYLKQVLNRFIDLADKPNRDILNEK